MQQTFLFYVVLQCKFTATSVGYVAFKSHGNSADYCHVHIRSLVLWNEKLTQKSVLFVFGVIHAVWGALWMVTVVDSETAFLIGFHRFTVYPDESLRLNCSSKSDCSTAIGFALDSMPSCSPVSSRLHHDLRVSLLYILDCLIATLSFSISVLYHSMTAFCPALFDIGGIFLPGHLCREAFEPGYLDRHRYGRKHRLSRARILSNIGHSISPSTLHSCEVRSARYRRRFRFESRAFSTILAVFFTASTCL